MGPASPGDANKLPALGERGASMEYAHRKIPLFESACIDLLFFGVYMASFGD
jgi:hypothetical protein